MAFSPDGNCAGKCLSQFITSDEVRNILTKHIHQESSVNPLKKTASELFWTEKFEHNEPYTDVTTGTLVHQIYSRAEIRNLVDSECNAFYSEALNPLHLPARLDTIMSKNLVTKFWLADEDHEKVIRIAWSILKRLPAIPPPLPDETTLDLIPPTHFTDPKTKSWQRLAVVSSVQQTFVRLVLDTSVTFMKIQARSRALGLGQTGMPSDRERLRILDGTAELIAYCVEKGNSSCISKDAQALWFIVRAYLWSFWQRLKTLHLYSFYAAFQYSDLQVEGPYLAQRNFMVAPGYSLARMTRELSESSRTSNMCTWVLNLVRSEPYSFGLDFGMIHQRYSGVLGQEPARCLLNSPEPCNGTHSNNCLRFYGADIQNQSAHDTACQFFPAETKEEPRLRWNRDSFLRVRGARAVAISEVESTSEIHYRDATCETMAISHVWSHGQGGRPEVGINQCLHKRYCSIAAELGCNSYWLDTTCIPTHHQLRKEAIMQINKVFSTSRVVLVCDKDLMKIDIRNLSMEKQESILAVTLFSDWNTRAWTLLESIKGRNNIFLLCKDRKTVNFRDLLRNVVGGGRLDVAVFIWHIYHMLPAQPIPEGMSKAYHDLAKIRVPADIGSLLSYRPASRLGDDFVIWSLLDNATDKPISNAKSFWQSQVGRTLSTGYLLSSAKRIHIKGLSWAPESPYATTRDHRNAPTKFHRPTGAMVTELGKIFADGFSATWRVFEIDSRLSKHLERTKNTDAIREEQIQKIRSKFLRFFEHGILLRPVFVHMGFSSEMTASFEAGISEEGTLVAVCASKKFTTRLLTDFTPEQESYRWTWRGVFEWPDHVPLPPFEQQSLFIC